MIRIPSFDATARYAWHSMLAAAIAFVLIQLWKPASVEVTTFALFHVLAAGIWAFFSATITTRTVLRDGSGLLVAESAVVPFEYHESDSVPVRDIDRLAVVECQGSKGAVHYEVRVYTSPTEYAWVIAHAGSFHEAKQIRATVRAWVDAELRPVPVVEMLAGDALACQICGTGASEAWVRCARCDTPHHLECWRYADGCSTYACGSRAIHMRAA
jgi:hypothetical protein